MDMLNVVKRNCFDIRPLSCTWPDICNRMLSSERYGTHHCTEFLFTLGLLIFFRCDECGYIVTRPRFLESHKQTHLPDAEKPYACNQCSRRFCWKSALRIHLISHQPVGERRLYVCHVCGRS